MNVNIDDSAGFCWGVVRTINKVEEILKNNPNREVYVLGDIIHNPREIERLEKIGLRTIFNHELNNIKNKNAIVIVRAHGEPPQTYDLADKLNLELIDLTCPLVQSLQQLVKKHYDEGYKIVIFGKKEHAEVIGLRGVCNDESIVIRTPEDAVEKVDLNRKTFLVSQTTMNKPIFYAIREALENKVERLEISEKDKMFKSRNTICKFVSGREDKLTEFAQNNDILIFVAGRNSSNGRSLYNVCKSANDKTYFVEDTSEIQSEWLQDVDNIGITGATSTPQWYMEHVKDYIINDLTIVYQ